jgi:hypothetical protein
MTLEQTVAAIGALTHDVKTELLDRVWLEGHGGQAPAHAQAWSDTLQGRIAEIEQGTAPLIALDEALAQVRQRLRR